MIYQIIIDMTFSNLDIKYISKNDFITLNSGFLITDDYSIHKQGPHIWGYMVIESVNEIEGSCNMGRLKYSPKNQSNYACILTSSQWSGEISIGYFFYSAREMVISNVCAVHGMKFAKIKFDYITN